MDKEMVGRAIACVAQTPGIEILRLAVRIGYDLPSTARRGVRNASVKALQEALEAEGLIACTKPAAASIYVYPAGWEFQEPFQPSRRLQACRVYHPGDKDYPCMEIVQRPVSPLRPVEHSINKELQRQRQRFERIEARRDEAILNQLNQQEESSMPELAEQIQKFCGTKGNATAAKVKAATATAVKLHTEADTSIRLLDELNAEIDIDEEKLRSIHDRQEEIDRQLQALQAEIKSLTALKTEVEASRRRLVGIRDRVLGQSDNLVNLRSA